MAAIDPIFPNLKALRFKRNILDCFNTDIQKRISLLYLRCIGVEQNAFEGHNLSISDIAFEAY